MHIVLLPGLDGTGKLFQPLLEVLPPELVPLVVSYPPDRVLSYRQLVPLVRAALPPSHPFILLGESFGGPLALELAAEGHPQLRGVVLCATFITNPLPSMLRWITWVPERWLRLILRLDAPDLLVRWLAAGWDAPQGLLDLFRQVKRQVTPEVLAARIRTVVEVNATEALRAARVPMVYLFARHDRLVSPRCLGEILVYCYDAQVPEFESPHLLLQRVPEEAVRAISRFVSTLEESR